MNNTSCCQWYQNEYKNLSFKAQRLYPNEELCRFLGREYFNTTQRQERKNIRILEVGCGSCANLWMIAREGFDAYGIDLAPESLQLGRKMLDHWKTEATLKVADMCDIPFAEGYFDVVVDIFASNCMVEASYLQVLAEIHRVLTPGGKHFAYLPSTASDAFTNPGPAPLLDEWTLDGIQREDSPFAGNFYPFRFVSPERVKHQLQQVNLQPENMEKVGRTYNNCEEYFEFITFSACKGTA